MKTCCEHHGIDCCQGRLCPEREPTSWAVISNVLFIGLYFATAIAAAIFAVVSALIAYTL